MGKLPDALEHRRPDRAIDPLFVRRWSPRAMTGEALTEDELLTLFEAGRWAPSTYNEQEWRFLYARRDGADWQTFFDLLAEGNKAWCVNAAVLVVVVSHRVFTRNGKPNPVHTFDCGSAFENIALQGTIMGLVVHGMQGFDYAKAAQSLGVPEDYKVEAMFAVGRPGDPDKLPEQLRKVEVPSGRKPVAEIICEGRFKF